MRLDTEPAAVTAILLGIIGVLTTSGLAIPDNLNEVVAHAVPVVMGAALAATTRPVKVPIIVAGVIELFVVAAALGINFPGPNDNEWLAAVSTLLTAIGALVVRAQVTPNAVPGVLDHEVVNG
jgi:hypothetical protein